MALRRRAAKERHDEGHVIGSLALVQSLLRFGLVDRTHLWLYPLLRGSGKRCSPTGPGTRRQHCRSRSSLRRLECVPEPRKRGGARAAREVPMSGACTGHQARFRSRRSECREVQYPL